jgi:hypothetical protein
LTEKGHKTTFNKKIDFSRWRRNSEKTHPKDSQTHTGVVGKKYSSKDSQIHKLSC